MSFVIIFRTARLPTEGKLCEWVRDPLHYLSTILVGTMSFGDFDLQNSCIFSGQWASVYIEVNDKIPFFQ
jgi:hypothetical protein